MRLTINLYEDRLVYSNLAVLRVTVDPSENAQAEVFVCKDTGWTPEPETGSSEVGSSDGLIHVHTKRVLYAVATLADLEQLPLTPAIPEGLYRAAEVAIMDNSKEMMDKILEYLIRDLRINAALQQINLRSFEVVTFTAPSNATSFWVT